MYDGGACLPGDVRGVPEGRGGDLRHQRGHVESHKKFAIEHELPFTLLSDPGHKVRDMFGAYGLAHVLGRVTYVVDKKGVIRMVFSSNIQPKDARGEVDREGQGAG